MPSVPEDSDLTKEHVSVPTPLYNFLVQVIQGTDIGKEDISDSREVQTTDKVRQRALSFAQDIVFATSRGRQMTPKHGPCVCTGQEVSS